MPRIDQEDTQSHQVPGGGGFTFTAAGLHRLGATEYTVCGIAIDVTGSTEAFAKDLRDMLIASIKACQKSPRSDNLLARVTTFSTSVGCDNELHGFEPLNQIDSTTYPKFKPDGLTPLFDASYASIGAVVEYGHQLMKNEFLANGIVFIITDGGDNHSTQTPAAIKKLIASVKKQEKLESLVVILIGINAAYCQAELELFQREAGIDKYIDAGNVTPGALAKLGDFVSQSVSSQSQAVGSGGPSQAIAATI